MVDTQTGPLSAVQRLRLAAAVAQPRVASEAMKISANIITSPDPLPKGGPAAVFGT
jgi:hypothetical protein